ncbi:saccharopine dehydrogenase family protein [Sphingobium chungbukense]|uniref:DUF5938 domain-containing protein n=1 Tax=Sphingobium chungbukense TaxID=56193 RepID=A0A0M3AJ67_9SPHN|nr:DUF5938 domain-containing protein [Sphingobium chungbukense]KKW90137.1 hypothetical protein YP76_22135 [Sphingobium chungbukense]
MSEAKVVLYGASGYTGKMIAGQLAARGIPFIAAGRNAERLKAELANNPELAGAQYEVQGVACEVGPLTELFRGKLAVYNTVGPMMQLASPIVEAALAAGCHYFDSSGEQDWTAHCRVTWGNKFAAAKLTLIPCMSMMWASGDLASALVLETAGIDTLDILYVPLGSSPSVASTLSFLRMCCQPQLKLVNKELVEWPPATTFQAVAPGTHEVLTCLPWSGGAEPIWYQDHATVRNCKVLVSFGSPEHMERTAALTREFREKWADQPADVQERATNEMGHQMTTKEPPRDDPNISRTIVSCHGRGEMAHATAVLWGVRGYDQTGHIGAIVLQRVIAGQLRAHGFVPPSIAFGARALLQEWQDAGLVTAETIR